MMNTTEYPWIDFIHDVLARLAQERENRKELSDKIHKLAQDKLPIIPKKLEDSSYEDIDPFSILGLTISNYTIPNLELAAKP